MRNEILHSWRCMQVIRMVFWCVNVADMKSSAQVFMTSVFLRGYEYHFKSYSYPSNSRNLGFSISHSGI